MTGRFHHVRAGWALLLAAGLGAGACTAGVADAPATVAAPDPGPLTQTMTLAALENELQTGNPQLRSAGGLSRAAQFAVEPARAPDNPTFNVTQSPVLYNPFAVSTSQGMTWSLSQNLPWPGKRGLSGDIAQALADQTGAQTDALRVQLLGQLRSTWFAWQQNRQQQQLLRAQLARLEQIKQATQLRYAQNAAAYADNINAQVAQAQTRTDLLGLENLGRTLLAQINGLIGRAPSAPLALDTQDLHPETEAPPLDSLRQQALQRNPQLKASRDSVRGAQSGVALAELGKRPDFNLALLFNSAAPPWDFGNNSSYGISLGVTFPLWYGRKEKNLLDQARAQLGAARDADEALRQQTLLSVDSAYLQWSQSLAQVRLLEQRVLEQARVAYRLSLSNYGTGQAGFVDLMNAYNAMNGAEIGAMQARAAAMQARVALDVAVGKL